MTQTPTSPPQGTGQSNGMAIAGMVLGIVALLGLCFWFVGVPAAVVGLILSFAGKSKAKQTGVGGGMATAGIVLNIIALVLVVLGILGVAALFTASESMREAFEEGMRNAATQPAGPNSP